MADIFISYSRRDKIFVQRLHAGLSTQQLTSWVDWEGIPYSLDWWKEICAGIESADSCVVIISPEALGSKVCNEELAYARQLNKRVVPIMRHEIDLPTMAGIWISKEWEDTARANWKYLEKLNWLYFRRQDECNCEFDENEQVIDPACDGPECDYDPFEPAFANLLRTLSSDDEYIKRHTRLLTRAREWEINTRNPSFLLRGDDLAVAQTWLRLAEGKTPLPTDLHRDYVSQSEAAETKRRRDDERLARRVTNFSRATAGLLVAMILAIIVGIYVTMRVIESEGQVRTASETLTPLSQTLQVVAATLTPVSPTLTAVAARIDLSEATLRQTESQRLAALSASNRILDGDPELSILLALRALRNDYSWQADVALQTALEHYSDHWTLPITPDTTSLLQYSADGQNLIVGNESLSVWDVTTRTASLNMDMERHYIQSFSADGRYALFTGDNSALDVRDTATGKVLYTLDVFSDSVPKKVLSPDGLAIATADYDNVIRLWDTAASTQHWEYDSGTLIDELAYSPTGDTIAVATADELLLLDAESGEVLRHYSGFQQRITALAFSADAQKLVAGDSDGSVIVWLRDTETPMQSFKAHTEVIQSVAFSRDGTLILSASDDKTASIWELQLESAAQLVRRLPFTSTYGVDQAIFAPDGKSIAVSHSSGVEWWSISTLDQQRLIPLPADGGVERVAYSVDGRYVALAYVDSNVIIYDTVTAAEVARYTPNVDFFTAFSFSADGRYLLVAGQSGTVYVYDTNGNKILDTKVTVRGVNSAAISPDGQFLVVGIGLDSTAILLNTETGQEVNQFVGHASDVVTVAFSADGKYVLTGSQDYDVRRWDITKKASEQRYSGDRTVTALAFAPDAATFAAGYDNGTIKLWDSAAATVLRTFNVSVATVKTISFSKDGTLLLAAADDGLMRLWNVNTGVELRRFVTSESLSGAGFTPDETDIATTGFSGLARLWATDYHVFSRYVCDYLTRDFSNAERQEYGLTDTSATCAAKREA